MKVSFEMIPPCEIAYIRQTGPYGAANLAVMEKLKVWARKQSMLNQDSIIYGIPQDNPATTQAETCRYDVCLVVPEGFENDDALITQGEFAGGGYVVFQIDHTAEAIQQAWGDIGDVLGKMGRSIDYSRPVIERYAARMIAIHQCEICVPICVK